MSDIYYIDSSSLIEIQQRYPLNVFPTIWNKVSDLVDQKRLIAPREVFSELKVKSDEIFAWSKRHKKMFKKIDNYTLVQQIIKKCPWIIDVKKSSTSQADPYVVALVISESIKQKGTLTHFTTPDTNFMVAEDNDIIQASKVFGLNSIKILNLFRNEKWSV